MRRLDWPSGCWQRWWDFWLPSSCYRRGLMSNDFETAPDTKPVLTIPTMMQVRTAPAQYEVAPDFKEEPTLRKTLCWQHGLFFLNDSGVRVRLPVEDCEECVWEKLDVSDMEEVR